MEQEQQNTQLTMNRGIDSCPTLHSTFWGDRQEICIPPAHPCPPLASFIAYLYNPQLSLTWSFEI